jgi:hypothetical protein
MMAPTVNEQGPAIAIDYRVRVIDFTGEIHQSVERILAVAIDRYDKHLDKVSVCLVDLNGPKGGVDRLCQVTARDRDSVDIQPRRRAT